MSRCCRWRAPVALTGCSRGFHARCHWLSCAPPIRCIILSVLYQYDGLERESDILPFNTYIQPNLPSHIENCIIHMIWRTRRAASYPPRHRPPSDSVRRALVPLDAATWTPVEGHPSARRPVLPGTWPRKIALPPDRAQFLFELFPFDPRRPAAMFRRIVRGGKGVMGEVAVF